MENIEQFAEVKTMLTDIAAAKAEWQLAAGGSIGEVAAGWLAPYYLLSVRGQLTALPEGPERFKLLRLAVADAVTLQRGGHAGEPASASQTPRLFHPGWPCVVRGSARFQTAGQIIIAPAGAFA